jgi:mannosyl-3-phosphoglycerate phosphatase
LTRERVVFSGVDGGLVEPAGGWDAARVALGALARLRIPLVLCSSRPRAELSLLTRLWGLDAPMIVENGAAVLVPAGHFRGGVPGAVRDGDCERLTLGPARERLAWELQELAREAGVRLPGAAEGYEYTVPVRLDEREAAALASLAQRRGLGLVRGPRYWHLCGGADKGLAVRTVMSLYQREGPLPRAIAIGAWPTDVPMLKAVHRPVLMPTPAGSVEPELAAAVPRAERAARGGAQGWSEAVLAACGHAAPPQMLSRIA